MRKKGNWEKDSSRRIQRRQSPDEGRKLGDKEKSRKIQKRKGGDENTESEGERGRGREGERGGCQATHVPVDLITVRQLVEGRRPEVKTDYNPPK